MNKLVFLTYTFPPQTSGATPVIMNLVKYLPLNGWEILPLTVSNLSGVMPIDPSLCDKLPKNLKVTKVYHSDPMQILDRLRGKKKESDQFSSPAPSESNGFFRNIIHNYLLVPDRVVTWFPTVIPAGLKLIRQEKADLIISHGPHHSTHLHARLLSRLTGIPHIAYFGDLWMYDSNILLNNRFNRRVEKMMEKLIIKHADGILAATPESVEYFRKEYGVDCPPATTLDNGYDPETVIPDIGNYVKRDHMLLTYTGNFWGEHSPEYFFAGLKKLLESWPDAPVLLRFIGNLSPRFRHLPEQYGICDNLEMIGTVHFIEVMKYQKESDVLLACLSPLPGSEVKNSSKLAEYLRVGKPVFAVAPEGTMTGYVKKFNAGYTAEPDPENIAAVLREIISDWQKNNLRHATDFKGIAEIFDGKNIMQRLGKFLDMILETGKRNK